MVWGFRAWRFCRLFSHGLKGAVKRTEESSSNVRVLGVVFGGGLRLRGVVVFKGFSQHEIQEVRGVKI